MSIVAAIAGNPNCGKTTLFNALTGVRQRTGNWPGVTVERKEGSYSHHGESVTVIDLPGIYSLDAASLDERVAFDYLVSGEADLVVNVVDASNLERNLYLSVQLREMGLVQIVVLNMIDVAKRRGIFIDHQLLAKELGCPVLLASAVTGEGIESLKAEIAHGRDQRNDPFSVVYSDGVEEALTSIGRVSAAEGFGDLPDRWRLLGRLEGRKRALSFPDAVEEEIEVQYRALGESLGGEVDLNIADARYGRAHTLAFEVTKERRQLEHTRTDLIDKVVLGKFTGIPVFLLVMYLMFLFTINVGSAFIDFFDGVAGAFFVDGLGQLMAYLKLPEWLIVIVAEGAGGGVQVVATFIPIVACLYLFLSVLEDSGYIARAAFVMERFMRRVGLPGKAFVPLIVGFGCSVPAVMATRTLEYPQDRRLATLMAPFMSCGARLPVYALFAAAFFPSSGQNVVFALYIIGIGAAIFTGVLLRRTLLVGKTQGFIMELPPYHLPTLRGVLLRTWDRVRVFVAEAGRIIVVMVLVLNVLQSVGPDGSFGTRPVSESILGVVSRAVTPVFTPMGIEEQNWPATVGIFTGILAKEAVVGTLDSIYSRLAGQQEGEEGTPFDLIVALKTAVSTVPENLGSLGDALLDPIGFGTVGGGERETAQELEVDHGVFGAMAVRFDGKVGAFAYLLFILLYFPCAATIGAVRRETGGKWAGFMAAWTTGIAYGAATLFYQLATFTLHPLASSLWLGGIVLVLALTTVLLRRLGRNPRSEDGLTSLQPMPRSPAKERGCH